MIPGLTPGRGRVRLALAAMTWLAAAFAFQCVAAPREVPLEMFPGNGLPDGRSVESYPAAADAILRVMVHRLRLPSPGGKLLVYATREEFEQGMVEHLKISPELARSTARFAKSAVGSCNVLVNEPAIADSTWPQRIELLAHELTHAAELTLARQCGLAHHQWLIEGFAEWVAYGVTDALKLEDLAQVRARLASKVRDLRQYDELPRIVRLDSFAQWVAARNKYSFDATYSFSFLVADYLVGRHSLGRVADYFRAFERSGDAAANFRAAFGETVGDFERALSIHLEKLLD